MSKRYVSMADTFLSNWEGVNKGKVERLIIECENIIEAHIVRDNAAARSDMEDIRITKSKPEFLESANSTSFKTKEDYPRWFEEGYFKDGNGAAVRKGSRNVVKEITGDYYSQKNNEVFMSVSQLKGFIQCENRQKAIVDGIITQPYIRPFLIGHYVHSAFESNEEFNKFVQSKQDEIVTLRALSQDVVIGNYKRLFEECRVKLDELNESLYEVVNTGIDKCVMKTVFDTEKESAKLIKVIEKEFKDDEIVGVYTEYIHGLISNNKELLHKQVGEKRADIHKADDMIKALKKDELAMNYMVGEKEVEMVGELFGCKWKIRVDNVSFFDGFFSDLKTTGDIYGRFFSPRHRKYVSFVDMWGYDLQMAVYQQIIYQNTGEEMDPFIVAVSKEDVPNIAVIAIDPERLEDALSYIEDRVDRAVSVKTGEVEPERCEKCNYCKQTKKLVKVVSVDSLLDD